jgi:hypothetical protein
MTDDAIIVSDRDRAPITAKKRESDAITERPGIVAEVWQLDMQEFAVVIPRSRVLIATGLLVSDPVLFARGRIGRGLQQLAGITNDS